MERERYVSVWSAPCHRPPSNSLPAGAVDYPESDGNPMSDNTVQYRWITMLVANIDTFCADFVAGDLMV